jgi:hypothetical protein
MGRNGWRFIALLALASLAGCVIPGTGIGGVVDADSLLPVPRRVNYIIHTDPLFPRTDIMVYKCKKDGTMVLVPIGSLDGVGIITNVNDDPDEPDEVEQWLNPLTDSYTFGQSGRFDVVVSYGGGAMTGRYSVWVQDPQGLGGGGGGGGGDGGNGIGIEWGN